MPEKPAQQMPEKGLGLFATQAVTLSDRLIQEKPTTGSTITNNRLIQEKPIISLSDELEFVREIEVLGLVSRA